MQRLVVAQGQCRSDGRMLTQMPHEFFPAARILVAELNAGRPETHCPRDRRRALREKALRRGFALLAERLALGLRRTRTTPGHDQGSGPFRIAQAEMQSRKSSHAESKDVSLVDP